MHIVERDEQLDYERFYDFPKGTDLTVKAGRRTWELLHGLADHYPCPPCKRPFQVLISGCHDVVNLHLGKPVHNPKMFDEFLDMIHDAEASRKKVHVHARHISR